MAARFDAAADRLLRTSDLLDYNAVYTWMAWVYLVSDLNAAGRFWSLNTDSTTNDFDFVGVTTDGTTLIARTAVGASTTTGTGTNLSIQTWYHVALVRSATNTLDVYLNGVSDSTHTRSTTGRTAVTRMEAGAWTSGNANRTDSRIMGMKAYTTNLTAAEIANEMNTIRPQRTDNLYAWWPIFNGDRTTDYNGNARPWTEGGTLTDEDPPPVSYGASVYFFPYANTAITGDASLTFGALTTTAAGTSEIAGTSSFTFGAITTSAAGTSEVAASANFTFGAVTTTATAAADIAGASSFTFGTLTTTADGANAIAGAASFTFGSLTLTADADAEAGGVASFTFGAVTVSSAGAADVAAAASLTFGALTLTSAGSAAIVGTANFTLGAQTVIGTLQNGTSTFIDGGYEIVSEALNRSIVAAPVNHSILAVSINREIEAEPVNRSVVAAPVQRTVIAA